MQFLARAQRSGTRTPTTTTIGNVRALTPFTVLIPAGMFVMGDDHGRPDERPAHAVHVSAFRIAVTPVTNAQYQVFVSETSHEVPRFWTEARFNNADQPVVGINWHDAVAYCEWLSQATETHWRLPTEAEREKAARGGDDADDIIAPGEGRFVQDAPRAVGLSAPNGYGLHDMTYNVHEWCADWYAARYYEVAPLADPVGPLAGQRRASRGGAWRHQVKISRCAARSSLDPTFRYNDYGFRVAGDADS
jgi:formylglycine-generating enzyme required for sulfatase activity